MDNPLLMCSFMALASLACATTPRAGLSAAEITSRSRALLASMDGCDDAALERVIPRGYVHVAHARYFDGRFLGQLLLAQRARRRLLSRVCDEERVFSGPTAATYLADCAVTTQEGASRETVRGLNTVVWVRGEGGEGRWVVAHTQWQPSGAEAERQLWNDTYRKGSGFSHAPNRLLVETVAGVTPSTALDVVMGQGRNALYLAERGWRVTGVDISDEGVRQARAAAAQRGLPLKAEIADIEQYDFGVERFGLVTMIYAGDDLKLVERLKPSVVHGGWFVLEYFAKDQATGEGGPGGFQAGELAKRFAGWSILKDEVTTDIADWGLVRAKLQRFIARRP